MKPVTQQEVDAIRRLAAEGHHGAEIARRIGRAQSVVLQAARHNGIALPVGRRGNRGASPEVRQRAIEMALAGVSIPQILMALPIGSYTLGRVLEPYRAQLEVVRAAKRAARDKRRGRPPRKRYRPRSAPKLSATDPRCAYHDCMIPLPEHGVCRPGVGNPCCVARGPRVTTTKSPPWGWLVDENMLATPDPAVEPVLARMVRLVESGMEMQAVAQALRWPHPTTVSHRMKLSGEMYQQWLAVRAGESRVAA